MNQRTGAVVLLGVAAIVVMVALVSRGWFRDRADAFDVSTSYSMGLWGNSHQQSCGEPIQKSHGSQCKTTAATLTWDKLSGVKDKAWLLFGSMTLILGLLAVASMIASMVLLIKRHSLTRTIWLGAVVGLGATMFCAGMFLALQPARSGAVGYSVFLFFPAAAAGIFGALISKDALDAPEQRPLSGLGVS